MNSTVWSALEKLATNEQIEPQRIIHSTGPIVISGNSLAGRKVFEKGYAESTLDLTIDSRFLLLRIMARTEKYSLAVPRQSDNFSACSELRHVVLFHRVNYELQRKLQITCIEPFPDYD